MDGDVLKKDGVDRWDDDLDGGIAGGQVEGGHGVSLRLGAGEKSESEEEDSEENPVHVDKVAHGTQMGHRRELPILRP